MTKNSKAIFLPRKVLKNLEQVGEQIKLARKRRKLSLSRLAERAQCTQLTLMRVEKGIPTVSMGIYARVLYALGLDEDLLQITKQDEAGKLLVDIQVMKRNERNKDEEDDLFD